MNDRQENKFSMYLKVDSFLSTNLSELTNSIPIMSSKYTEYSGLLTNLQSYVVITNADNTGYRLQKQIERERLTKATLVVAHGYTAYALDTNNNPLGNTVNYTKSELDNMRDSDFFLACDSLAAKVAPIPGNTLTPYGVTTTMKNDLESARTAYRNLIQAPMTKKAEVAGAGTQVDALFEAIDNLLIIIDNLIGTIMVSNPFLYYQYRYDRKTDDTISGPGASPDVVATLAPGIFQVVLTVPYLSGRSFKVRNKGTDTLNWGLSTSQTAFTDIVHTVDGGAESTKTSSTLAPSGAGNYVLFQNTSANPIDFELTVFE